MSDQELKELVSSYVLTTDNAEAEKLLLQIHAEYEKRGQLVKSIA